MQDQSRLLQVFEDGGKKRRRKEKVGFISLFRPLLWCWRPRRQQRTHQDQLPLQLLRAATRRARLHHVPVEQRADTGPLLQEHLHQGHLLRPRQQQRQPRGALQQEKQQQRHRHRVPAPSKGWHGSGNNRRCINQPSWDMADCSAGVSSPACPAGSSPGQQRKQADVASGVTANSVPRKRSGNWRRRFCAGTPTNRKNYKNYRLFSCSLSLTPIKTVQKRATSVMHLKSNKNPK